LRKKKFRVTVEKYFGEMFEPHSRGKFSGTFGGKILRIISWKILIENSENHFVENFEENSENRF